MSLRERLYAEAVVVNLQRNEEFVKAIAEYGDPVNATLLVSLHIVQHLEKGDTPEAAAADIAKEAISSIYEQVRQMLINCDVVGEC